MEILFYLSILVLCALILIPLFQEFTWKRLFISLLFNGLGIALPLFVFVYSSLLIPDWKGACENGWLSCFIEGKLALTPVVLLACAALYRIEILTFEPPAPRWVEVGLFQGALVASFCTLYGVFVLGGEHTLSLEFWLWMSVPFYVSVYHVVRSVQFLSKSNWGVRSYVYSLLGSLPLWLWSMWWSLTAYEKLPDTPPPDCFVVTAAGRGHPRLVGPFREFPHGGLTRSANGQLVTFWTFEDRWRGRFPRSHRLFRLVYNRLGPHLARRIRSPWLADAVWLALKPLELIAKLACGR